MYIVVSNGDSGSYYGENTPNHFRVKLSKPLRFESEWSVGLCEIHITENSESKGVLGLNLDICTGLIIDGVQTHVLRKFNCKRNVHEAFPIIYYMPVDKLFLDTLDIYLTGASGVVSSLTSAVKVECTLHFKPSCIDRMYKM
jgi:hypothetical protein